MSEDWPGGAPTDISDELMELSVVCVRCRPASARMKAVVQMIPHSRIDSRVSGLVVDVEDLGSEEVRGSRGARLGRRIFMNITDEIAYPSICEGTK